jgi:adenine-specific DNA-methyltransferase
VNKEPLNQENQETKAQLHELSQKYLTGRPKSERSPLGQFLTPRSLRDSLIKHVPLSPGMKVLDPGVGTGEFLLSCIEKCDKIVPYGWDIDNQVLDVAQRLVPNAQLSHRSALDKWDGEKFDVVIGNPPYFEMRSLDSAVKRRYSEVISGRPNIFSLFFQLGYEALADGGYLAYVVPPSMNNGAYFDRLRAYILKNFAIKYLEVFDNPFLFEDVQTAVQLIVLKKGSEGSSYVADLGEICKSEKQRTIFTSDPERIVKSFRNRKTLFQLGYQAITGTVVWNTRKDDLRNDSSTDSVPLIWAHNITTSREIVLDDKHPKRPQFVTGVKPMVGPAIVVNRITGSVGSGSLRCAMIPNGMDFVGENHVNVIVPQPEREQLVDWDLLLSALRKPEINERIRLLTGNTQVSATELTNWIPLDIQST